MRRKIDKIMTLAVLSYTFAIFLILPDLVHGKTSYPPWKISLEKVAKNVKTHTSIGIHDRATDRYDSTFDNIAFSPVSPNTDYLFSSLIPSSNYYLSRQVNGANQKSNWELKVTSSLPVSTSVDITWEKLPNEFISHNLTLTDTRTGNAIDMQNSPSYRYVTISKTETRRVYTLEFIKPVVNLALVDSDGDGIPDL